MFFVCLDSLDFASVFNLQLYLTKHSSLCNCMCLQFHMCVSFLTFTWTNFVSSYNQFFC